jgi:hypothetical protein
MNDRTTLTIGRRRRSRCDWRKLRHRLAARGLRLCAALLLSLPTSAAQFVEVNADLEITTWRYQEETGLPLKNSRGYSMRCVVGTNTWLIENHSQTNFKESVWFVDGRIVRQTVNQDSAADELGIRTMRRSPRSASVLSAPDGYPGGELLLNLPWFAFCSGPYLKLPGHSVPLPTPTQDRVAFGFRAEVTAFADSLGLPRRVAFYTGQRQLKCDYQVQLSTNVLGWNFPTAFTVVQNEPNDIGQWNRQLSVSGRVISIQPAKKPELPVDIQQRLELMDQFPTRRK